MGHRKITGVAVSLLVFSFFILTFQNCGSGFRSGTNETTLPEMSLTAASSLEKVSCPLEANPAPTFSETCLGKAQANGKSYSNLIEYTPQYPLFSDSASKRRWMYLPAGQQINTSNPDEWIFPVGTVFWKEFSLGGKKIETRQIEKVAGQWRYSVYLWSRDQLTATRVETLPSSPDFAYADIKDKYAAPPLNQCTTCHAGTADRVLGFNYLQLSHQSTSQFGIAQLKANQWLSQPPAGLDEIQSQAGDNKLQASALGYLYGNCSSCHNGQSNLPDFRHVSGTKTASEEKALQSLVSHNLIDLANPSASVVLSRMNSSTLPMPPRFVHSMPDTAGVALIQNWIQFLASAPAGTGGSPSPMPVPSSGPSVSVNYSENSGFISNPERGFYAMVNCNSGVTAAELQSWKSQGHTFAMCSFSLKAFINSAISPSALDLLQRDFDMIRANGMKAIVRFSYSDDTNGIDTTLAQMKAHMDQLAPILSKNKDMISLVQAGFIGGWGEWAYSTHFGSGLVNVLSAQNLADRKAVLDKLLQIVPSDRMIQIRYPAHKMYYYGNGPLSSAEAFTGTPNARIGHHNDCFLASNTDWGTYINSSTEYPYLATETKSLVMGGETCNYNPPRSDCSTALKELAMFHYSFLNSTYHQTVLANFKTQGCYEEIKSRLGYRFVLQSGTFSGSARAGELISVKLNIVNQGFAAPFNERHMELILRHTSTGAVYKIPMLSDPRRWLPGATISISENLQLPASLPAGSYNLLLNLPDLSASLASRPEYSIQLANLNTWEPSTGFNKLNHTLVVNP